MILMNLLTEKDELTIIDKYKNNVKVNVILKEYEITVHTFRKALKKHNVPRVYDDKRRKRKYKYDTLAFKEIKTEEQAYFLGFLMADGSIRSTKSCWGVQLTVTDLDIVEKFAKFMDTNAPIKTENKSTHEIKRRDSYTIYINSKEIVEDLAKLGVVNNKTFRTFIPEIPNNLVKHFIRGYFDADGCLYVRPNMQNSRSEPSITSASKLVVEQIQKHLKEQGLLRIEREYIRSRRTYWTLTINNKDESMKFLDYIYQNATIYMERKYKKYQLVKNRPYTTKSDVYSSKYFGVSRKTDELMKKQQTHKRFTAYIYINQKTKFIGNFYNEKDAALAYNAMAEQFSFPKEKLNQIE